MTYKNALAGINSGGGKSVIIGNPKTDKTPRLFQAMGEAIGSLGGRYIAAEDSGTTPADMAVMAESTQFVAGLDSDANSGDPSPSTALGVFLSIREAVRFRFNESALTGLRVNIQGLGKVGYELARLLIDEGVVVTASDINDDNCIRANQTLGVKIASNTELMSEPCEVFAPCALGGVINQWSIPTLNTAIVAGAANNQLLTSDDHQAADRAGILYCPDYLINAGGVIDVYHRRQGASQAVIDRGIANIPGRLRSVLEEAKSRSMSSELIAQERAEQLISAALPAPEVTEAA
jgi:leucine dehydrogenase